MSSTDPGLVSLLAPSGRLRAAINLGNPILAHRDAAGQPAGVSVDLAQAMARQLGVDCDLIVGETAGQSVARVRHDEADLGFFAVDPLRGEDILFSAPYVLIQGCYLVRQDSPLQVSAEVDRPGRRITVGAASAYDLFLSREIKHATLVRAITSPAVVATFLANGDDVAAGVKQQLEADALRTPGLRLLPGAFMVIQQALGVPQGRGPAVQAWVVDFVESMKSSGFVAQALARHQIVGAAVAPAAA